MRVLVAGGGIGGLTTALSLHAAERVLRLVDERCPPDCESIRDYVALDEMEEMSRRYQRIAGFDRGAVNEQPV